MSTATREYISSVWKFYAYKFFTGLHFFGAILIPFFTEWGGLNFTQIFFLQAWFMFWIFALEVPTGTFADRFGKKNSVLFGIFLNVLGVLLYIYEPRFEYFLAAEFLWAAASAFISGADEALLYESLKSNGLEKESKKTFSHIASIGLLGIGVASPIGSVLVAQFGFPSVYYATAGAFLIAGLIVLTVREPKIPTEVKKPYWIILKEGMKYLRHHKVLQILAWDAISIGTISYFMIWLFQPLLQSQGIGIAAFGFVHTALVGAQILALHTYPSIEKRIGSKKRLLFLTGLATGIGFIIAGLSTNPWMALLGILIAGGIGLSRRPFLSSYMQKHIPSDMRATVGSTISMFRTLAITLANLVVGTLTDWSLPNTLLILGIAGIGFALLSRVEEEHLID